MRLRRIAALVAALLLWPVVCMPAQATEVVIGGNVTYLGTIPEVGSVSGRIAEFDTSRGRIPVLVTNNHRGISTYDVSEPATPVLLNHLPVAHFYSEDVEWGGNILLATTDPGWVTRYGAGIWIVDISDVENLKLHYTNVGTANRWTDATNIGGAGHTISCIRADCSYAYVNGTSTIVVADLTNPAAPTVAGTFKSQVGSTHDIQVDDTGIAWMVGSGGIVGLDTTNPLTPRVVAGPHKSDLGYHHNSLRPKAANWSPRTSADFNDPTVRDGELVMITEERAWPVLEQRACKGQGRFQTQWLRDTDALGTGSAAAMETLDTWETELQVAGIAAPAINWCSAHYFAQSQNLVAIAWYEQGVRILDVSDPRNIQQVGYFIAKVANSWSTVWAGESEVLGGQIVYAFDQTRGIDILRIGDAGLPVEAPILPHWTGGATPATPAKPHETWGFGCRLAEITVS